MGLVRYYAHTACWATVHHLGHSGLSYLLCIRLPSGLFHLGFLTKTLYSNPFFSIHAPSLPITESIQNGYCRTQWMAYHVILPMCKAHVCQGMVSSRIEKHLQSAAFPCVQKSVS